MHKQFIMGAALAAGSLVAMSPAQAAGIYITEWMYNGAAEFVEFTNLGASPVDFTGWSYDDDSNIPGVLDLSSFGLVAPGESVIITENTAADFRASWNLAARIKVIGEYTNNLGRNDQINLYDATNTRIDRLSYGDQNFPGSIRTADISGRPTSAAALGADDVMQWEFSALGNADGAYFSLAGELGSPGSYANPVPLPAAVWLLAPALLGLTRRRRTATA